MERVGFGVIGVGLFGENHALVYSRLPETRLAAVCDLNAQRAAEVAARYGADKVYADYRQLLADPEIKAVSIATPDFAHRDIAIAAAEAGKHMLVEKPLATTVAESEAVVQAARAAGVTLMVDFHNRCNPPFVSARRSIEAGEIGRPTYVYARLSNTTFVPTQMLSWGAQTSALWFLGSHVTDLTRWLLNDEPRRVYAVARSGILKGMGVDTADFHIALIEFAGGAVATLENAWILPETEPNVFNFKYEVLGSAGSIHINTSDHRAAQTFTAAKAALPDVLGVTPTGPHRVGGFVLEAIAQFVDAVLYDRPVLATGEDGVAVTRVLTAIEESARTGRPVDL